MGHDGATMCGHELDDGKNPMAQGIGAREGWFAISATSELLQFRKHLGEERIACGVKVASMVKSKEPCIYTKTTNEHTSTIVQKSLASHTQ